MKPRLEYSKVAPEAYESMRGLQKYVDNCGLDELLKELVKLQGSQINGCAYCIDTHSKEARPLGETEQPLYGMDAWRESPFYTDRERAALAWAEAITLINQTHVPDEVFEEVIEHFSEKELEGEGIGYIHMPGLGGLRHAQQNSMNLGLRNPSFRGFADYMQTMEFKIALNQLIVLSRGRTVTIVCAEAVPWRCHRSLNSDALQVRAIEVREIISSGNIRIHASTPWAKVVGEEVTYPALVEKLK